MFECLVCMWAISRTFQTMKTLRPHRHRLGDDVMIKDKETVLLRHQNYGNMELDPEERSESSTLAS